MKTDRFSDIIRRKLESIRPEFAEKDWVRMQATLHQAGIPQPGHAPTGHPFSGGVWSGGQSWLLAAASVSTAALIGVGIWQHNQINDLRQTVAQLKQKAPVMQTAPPSPATTSPMVAQTNDQPAPGQTAAQSSASTPREQGNFTVPTRDTVYIDRYTTTPASPYLEKKSSGGAQKEANQFQQSQSAIKNYAATDRSSTATGSLRRQNDLTVSPKTDSYGTTSTPLTNTNTKSNSNQPGQVVKVNPSTDTDHLVQSERVRDKSGRNDRYASATRPTNIGRSQQAQSVSDLPTQTTAQSAPIDQPEATAITSASYESIASLPLSPQTVNWNALLAQQAKRIRPARVITPTPLVAKIDTKAPASKPEKRIEHMGMQFRAGLGAEIASHLWSTGVYTETLLGKHWTIGVGLNQITYTGKFVDDFDFYEHTRRDFRTEFAPKIDPRRNILNIDAQTTRVQIPLSIGYRIPLTASLAFVPTAGTYLNLSNTEKATYYCPVYNPIFMPPRNGVDEFSTSNARTVELINSFAVGTGIEWRQKHWVVQGSPVLTVPLQADLRPTQPEPNWQQNPTLGFRARLLYQF